MNGLDYFREACGRNPNAYELGANGMYRCPCCLAFTLDTYNQYDICRVCWWEDDGAVRPDDFGGPNGMTLKEGRDNYAASGCSDGTECTHNEHMGHQIPTANDYEGKP